MSAKKRPAAEISTKVIAPGDAIPSIIVDHGFNPIGKVNMAERTKGKKVIILGLPGAFTPCCSSVQVPGYLAKQAELKEKGVDEVLVYCVNDGAVMQAWAKDQKVEGSIITFLADTRGEFSKAIGMCMDHPGPLDALGNTRCKRFVLVVEDGTVKKVEVSEAADDPAGDNEPDGPVTKKTRVEHILTHF